MHGGGRSSGTAAVAPRGCSQRGARKGRLEVRSAGALLHSHFTIKILDAYPLIVPGKNLQVRGDAELYLKPGDSFETYLGGALRRVPPLLR